MKPQSQNYDFEEEIGNQTVQARSEHYPSVYGAFPQVLKFPKTIKNMTPNEPIHDYDQCLIITCIQ
ncbi:MAG: hypothetical protein FWH37_07225 [Candidatus Bathyarchaeota archaeon]|nr:hypothetical protein [Candidatus Termiticorpusculum sp.]